MMIMIVMVIAEVDKMVEGRMIKEVNVETLRVEIIKIIGDTMIDIDGLGTIIMDMIKIRVAEIKIMITNLSMIETRVIGIRVVEIKLMIKGNILIMTLMDIMTIINGPGMLIQIIDIIRDYGDDHQDNRWDDDDHRDDRRDYGHDPPYYRNNRRGNHRGYDDDPPPRRDYHRRNRRNNIEIDDDFEDDDRVRMTKYDGKVNWKAWFMQFDDIADRRRWNYTTKLGKLKELLKDDALAYFSRLPLNVRESYRLLCEKMNLRFGQKDTPRTAQTQVFVIKQKDEEELEEWAERCMSVSMDGWQDQSEVVAQEQAVNAFLHGARERDSALAVMDKEPASIDEAVRQMRQATTNRQTFSRSSRSGSSIRTIYMEEDDQPQDVSFSEQDAIREIKKPFHNPNRVSFQDNKVKEMEKEMSQLKEVLDARDKRVDEILNLLKEDKRSSSSPHSYRRDGSQSPQRSSYRSSYSPDRRSSYRSSYSPDRRSFSHDRRDYDSRYSRSPSQNRYDRYDDRRQNRYDRYRDRESRDHSPGYNRQRDRDYQSDRSRDGRSYRSYDRPQYGSRNASPNSQYRSPSRSPSPSFRRSENNSQSFLRRKEDTDSQPKE